jgi:hypothetical protein
MSEDEILERSKVVAEMILDLDVDISDVMDILRTEHYGEEACLRLQHGPGITDDIIWGRDGSDYPMVYAKFAPDPAVEGLYGSGDVEAKIIDFRRTAKIASKKAKVSLKPLSKLKGFDYGYFCDAANIFTAAYYGCVITSPLECVQCFKKFFSGKLPDYVSRDDLLDLLRTWFVDKTIHLTCANYERSDAKYTIEFTKEGVSQWTSTDYDNYECSWNDIFDMRGKYKSFEDSDILHLLVEMMLNNGEKFEKDDIYYDMM